MARTSWADSLNAGVKTGLAIAEQQRRSREDMRKEEERKAKTALGAALSMPMPGTNTAIPASPGAASPTGAASTTTTPAAPAQGALPTPGQAEAVPETPPPPAESAIPAGPAPAQATSPSPLVSPQGAETASESGAKHNPDVNPDTPEQEQINAEAAKAGAAVVKEAAAAGKPADQALLEWERDIIAKAAQVGPKEVLDAKKFVLAAKHENFLKKFSIASQVMDVDPQAAIANFKEAYEFFTDGHSAEFEVVNTTDEKTGATKPVIMMFTTNNETGKRGASVPLTRETVAGAIRNFSDRLVYATWTQDRKDKIDAAALKADAKKVENDRDFKRKNEDSLSKRAVESARLEKLRLEIKNAERKYGDDSDEAKKRRAELRRAEAEAAKSEQEASPENLKLKHEKLVAEVERLKIELTETKRATGPNSDETKKREADLRKAIAEAEAAEDANSPDSLKRREQEAKIKAMEAKASGGTALERSKVAADARKEIAVLHDALGLIDDRESPEAIAVLTAIRSWERVVKTAENPPSATAIPTPGAAAGAAAKPTVRQQMVDRNGRSFWYTLSPDGTSWVKE